MGLAGPYGGCSSPSFWGRRRPWGVRKEGGEEALELKRHSQYVTEGMGVSAHVRRVLLRKAQLL